MTGNVLSMDVSRLEKELLEQEVEIADGAVSSTLLAELLAHWRELRGRAAIPLRSAFDPMRVPRLLPSLFLFGLEADSGRFRVRVMGTRLSSLLGREITGQYLDAAALPEEMRLPLEVRCIAGEPFVLRGTTRLPPETGAAYEILGLPLAGSDGDFRFLLGAMDFCILQ